MKYLLLIILSLVCYLGLAQDIHLVDSLKQLLSRNISDNQKVHIYVQLSNEESDASNAELYVNKAVLLAKKMAIDSIIVISVLNKAEILSKNHKNEEASKFLEEAAKNFEKTKNFKFLSDIYNKQGDIQLRIKKYKKALQFYHKGLRLRSEIKDSSRMIGSNLGIGFVYSTIGTIDSAQRYYLISCKLCEQTNDILRVGAALNSLGSIYQNKGIIDSAIYYYSRAKDCRIAAKQWDGAALVLDNIGTIYLELEHYDEAIDHFKKGLEYAIMSHSKEAEAYSLANLAILYSKKGHNKYALQLIDSATTKYTLISKQDGIVMCYNYKGYIYERLNQLKDAMKFYKKAVWKARNDVNCKFHEAELLTSLGRIYVEELKYDTAEYSYKSSLKISLAKNYIKITLRNYKGLSNLAKRRGQDSIALSYYKKYSLLHKEIFNNNSVKEFSKMRAEYRNKYEQEEAILQDKLDKVNIHHLTIVVIIIAIFLLIVLFLLVNISRRQKKLTESKAVLAKQNESIISQKNNLAQKENSLRDLNYELYCKTDELRNNKKELESTVVKLKKATEFRNRILSIIGHDLKGPIGTMSRVLSLIMDEDLATEERNMMLSLTQKSAVSAFNLLDNLLIWAKNEQSKIEYKPENIILNTLLSESVSLLHETAIDKNINIETALEDDIELHADANMVSTVIRNLLSNAIKFSKKNGKVIISTKKLNQFAEISVKDNGIGISQENLCKILNQDIHFSSMGTEGEQGSGLGLQLCFEFIKKNKGAYEVKSEIGKGSNFIFTLPLANNEGCNT